MAGNVETLREAYEAFARGDMDTVMSAWNDDIVWEGPNAEELPGGGTHRGKQAVAAMLGEISQRWERFEAPADEFVDGGDTVVILGHVDGRTKETGKDVQVPYVHVWRMSGGKADRVLTLTDTAVVLAALKG